MSEQQGGGGEDDITNSDEIKHSSAVHDTVHSPPFFRETKKWWFGKQLVVIWADGNRRALFILLTSFLFLCMFFTGIYFSYRGFQLSTFDIFSCSEKTILYICVCLCLCICVSVCFLGVWTFLWFVCFCLLANQWGRSHDVRGIPMDAARATVAFSFFSIATWVSGTAVVLFSLKTVISVHIKQMRYNMWISER